MSRKQTIAAQKVLAEQAIYQKQGMVWMRSLQRNDADIAAVLDLNRSLHVVKNAFLQTYNNELLLLQVGQGKYKLSPDGSDHLVKPVIVAPTVPSSPSKSTSPMKGGVGTTNDSSTPIRDTITSTGSVTATITIATTASTVLQYQSISYDEISAEQQELCVDFLLRKKLRRKLISRIIRRLQRIATSMDHLEQMTIPSSTNIATAAMTDIVAPAGPPKYGDLRLYCDPMAVQEFAHIQQRQFAAWQYIIKTREQEGCDSNKSNHSNEVLGISPSPASSPKRHMNKNLTNPANTGLTTSSTSNSYTDVTQVAVVVEEDEKEETSLQQREQCQDEKEVDGEPTHTLPNADHEKVEQEIIIDPPATTRLTEDGGPEIHEDDVTVPPTVSSSGITDKATTTTTATSSGDDLNKEAPSFLSSSMDATSAKEVTIPSTKDLLAPTAMEDHHSDPMTADYELFKDYKDAYEKMTSSVVPMDDRITASEFNDNVALFLQTLPPDRMEMNYTILQDTQRVEDYVIIKNGIGATHPNMTIQDREVEYQKWQSNLLSRIPEQPTYAEIGVENRVFLLDQRLQRAMEQQQQRMEEKTSLSEQLPVEENEDDMDIEDQENTNETPDATATLREDNDDIEKDIHKTSNDDANEDADAGNEFIDKEKDEIVMAVDENNNDDETKKDSDKVVEPKKLRPISLVAIPSFYEQDLKRIKLVQSELMSSSMRDHAIHRLEDATREFNQCLTNSMELANQRTYLQNQVNALSQQIRALTQTVHSDYMVQVSSAKNRWNLDRCSFETNKLNQLLPSRNGIMPTGSMMTQSYKTLPDRFAVGLNEIVAACIADIVDCVDNIGNGRVRNDRFEEPLVLPASNADLESLHRAKQMEATKRNELNTYTLKLRTSEGERLRAWRKMLKTKMEFDIPHQHYSSSGQLRSLRLDQGMCTNIPLPGLHQTAAQNVPQELPGRSSVATYTPMHTVRAQPKHVVPMSDSKYSTARVRERISSDGTVAPVTKPKMTADGLYLRPAGRTRKGMEWDAVRGIWIPASEAAAAAATQY